MNNAYINIKRIAEVKGLKSTRSIRIAIQKGKYIAREVKVNGGTSYEILYSSLESEIQEKLENEEIKNMITAFLVGGFVGLIGEVLIKVYLMIDGVSQSVAVSLMMVTIIFLACLFTALGFFDNWVSKAGAGLFIPISGFAHATTSSALEYKHEGLVMGIGSNIFKLSGSVILYGVVAAYVFGIIRFVFFGG